MKKLMNHKKIHFIGIKGVGVAPLAIVAKEAGFEVSGCDIDEMFITDELLKKAKIKTDIGFDKNHIYGKDLVVTTGAHGGFDNLENIEAKRLNIPVFTQGEAVARFMDGTILAKEYDGISVSGTHGKTTTTAMIATILKANNMDPSFIVGTGMIKYLESSGHYGKGRCFVAEADEYATEPNYDKTPKLLWQKPLIGVITNIEFDHPDVYKSLEDLTKTFLRFANGIRQDGALVLGVDGLESQKLYKNYQGKCVTFGFSKDADYRVERINLEPEKSFFWVFNKETNLGEFSINVTGEHNILNALAAIVVCIELGLSISNIKQGLLCFKGTKRRMEFIKKLKSGALVFDDYAHHPTEIKKTLEALKKSYSNKKIVCIFQPHTYSRTKALFEQFITSFNNANILILTKIYSSAREVQDKTVSSMLLAEVIAKSKNDVLYMENLDDVVKYVDQKSFDKEYIILTMGAGDIYKISEKLI